MNKNFYMLLARIIDSNNCVDYEKMVRTLKRIKRDCICIGTGGSLPVSQYASKILNYKNNIITSSMEPRDVLSTNIGANHNICAFTYGGDNEGINKVLDCAYQYGLNRHVFTSNNKILQDILNDKKKDYIINYSDNFTREKSFISIASSFIPMSLLLRYYMNNSGVNFFDKIADIHFKACEDINDKKIQMTLNGTTRIEILSGDYTYTASKILESTLVEAGLITPLVHEKYSYCHGRTTLAHSDKTASLIYLINQRKGIDDLLLENCSSLYQGSIVLSTDEQDPLIGEYDLSLRAMLFANVLAQNFTKDLSKVGYAPQVKVLYKYKGEL